MAGSRQLRRGLMAAPAPLPKPPIDVLVSAVGSWSTVRVQQPFAALQAQGWDVRIHERPFDLNRAVRPNGLVIWQRPVPESWDQWRAWLQGMRRRGCLLLVEWDDHPELFPAEVRELMASCGYAHLQLAHALQCSGPRLAKALRAYHHLPLVVENGIDPLGADIGADSFHDLPGGEGRPEDIDGPLAAGRAHHVALRSQHPPEGIEFTAATRGGKVDPAADCRGSIGGRGHASRIPTFAGLASDAVIVRLAAPRRPIASSPDATAGSSDRRSSW